jgi:hypothetical protein
MQWQLGWTVQAHGCLQVEHTRWRWSAQGVGGDGQRSATAMSGQAPVHCRAETGEEESEGGGGGEKSGPADARRK